MKFLRLIPILFIFFGVFPYKNSLYAGAENPKNYKVLSNNKNLSITVDMTEGNSFLEYFSFGFKIYNKENAKHIAIGGDYKSNNHEIGLGMTFLVSQLLGSTNFKNREKIYIPYNIDNKKIKLKKSFILIKELFARKDKLKEAKKQNCNYILNKNGKLKKVN